MIADNYLEGYHIPVGHPGLLRLLDYKRYLPTPARTTPGSTGRSATSRLEGSASGSTSGCCGRCPASRRSWRAPGRTCTCGRPRSSTSTPTRSTPGSCPRRPAAHPHRGARVSTARGGSLRDRIVRAINWRFNKKVMDEDVELCDMRAAGPRVAHLRAGRAEPKRERRAATSTTCCAGPCRASTSHEARFAATRRLAVPDAGGRARGAVAAGRARRGRRSGRAGQDRAADPPWRHRSEPGSPTCATAARGSSWRRWTTIGGGRRAAGRGAPRAVPAGAGASAGASPTR